MTIKGYMRAGLGLLILALIVGAFFYGRHTRGVECALASTTVERDQAQAQVQVVEAVREDDQASQSSAQQVEAERVQASANTEANFRVITREVIRYVQANPDPAGCMLGPDGLRAWRAANAGTAPGAEPDRPGGAGRAVPAAADAR